VPGGNSPKLAVFWGTNKTLIGTESVAQAVEFLLCKCEALSSSPSLLSPHQRNNLIDFQRHNAIISDYNGVKLEFNNLQEIKRHYHVEIFFFLRQDLTVQPGVALNSPSSCISFLRARVLCELLEIF
jgi:hypothetical protein